MNFINDINYLAHDGQSFSLNDYKTHVDLGIEKKEGLEMLESLKEKLSELQERLYAENKHSLLIVFQAMDAAGKDGTIRSVMSGINPQGCNVVSFKQPSREELQHDFLWRCYKALPEKGKIGIFNRSYYEEVLVTRVHPEYILGQNLPGVEDVKDIGDGFWKKRFESIREFEKHITRNGTTIIKFYLNVSKEEQKKRFLERIDTPEKNWKFSYNDIKERRLWEAYRAAYEEAIRNTSESAPWYVIPADSNWSRNLLVCNLIYETLLKLNPNFPELDAENMALLQTAKQDLEVEKP